MSPVPNLVPNPDFAIAGAGIIGLTIALELHSRGARVCILDTAAALRGASSAAAGMLAAEDPHNPPELRELSLFSLSLYDPFLARLSALSGLNIPYQTTTTLQYLDSGAVVELPEKSVDPRQLGAAALEAVRRSSIPLLENCERIEIREAPDSIVLQPLHGPAVTADQLIHASGAWFEGSPPITPRKGQMLRVRVPAKLNLNQVHRSSSIYVVPRTQGPQAGTALIGATEEDAGFDLQTHPADLHQLRLRASALLPELGDAIATPQVEAWAGLRPATADRLPLIGRMIGRLPHATRQWIAGGHYRNGILLTPATAVLLADLLENNAPPIDLQPFDPARSM